MKNIVGALFTAENEAREAMAALAENPEINGTTIYQISLVKRKEGVLKLCDNFTSDALKSNDTVKGGLVGGLIGLLAGVMSGLYGVGALLAAYMSRTTDSPAAFRGNLEKLAAKRNVHLVPHAQPVGFRHVHLGNI